MRFLNERSPFLTLVVLLSLVCGQRVVAQVTISDEVNPALWTSRKSLPGTSPQFLPTMRWAVDQQVINGVVVDERFFPAIFGKMRTGESTPSCTASLIGPGTMLIAAHCVDDSPAPVGLRCNLSSRQLRDQPSLAFHADTELTLPCAHLRSSCGV